MSFKLKLKAKIRLDNLLQRLLSAIKDKPGNHRLDKGLARELLDMTGFKKKKVRDLDLYVLPKEGEIMEIAILGNELAIYRTTLDDIAMRKSPYWHEVLSISNVKKIMNDKDVIISKGRESLERLYTDALALLDLVYTKDDILLLLEDARNGLEQKSITQIQESLDLFVGLLDFKVVSFGGLTQDLHLYAGIKFNGGTVPTYKPTILFDKKKMYLGMKKEAYKPRSDNDLAWFIKYTMKKEEADLKGIDVFIFLFELALEKVLVP